MPRARNISLSIIVFAAVLIGYWFTTKTDSPVHDQDIQSTREAGMPEDLAEPTGPAVPMNPREEPSDPAQNAAIEAAGCISPSEWESDPVLAAEIARLDSLVTSGPTIESYRGLSSAALAGLANQGDSAAMAVLGAMSVMKAMKFPEKRAVAYLLLEDPNFRSFDFEQPLERETAEHLEAATDWFYKAALHGRLLALQNVGEIIAISTSSPMELGWIQQAEYDSLPSYERQALDPINVYGALAFEIAPELQLGPLGETISALTPGGDRQQLVLNELAWQFRQDQEAAGLPPIEIPESTAPSLEELESMLCGP